MNLIDDPDLIRLPHPFRVDLAAGEQVDVNLLRHMGLYEAVWPKFEAGEITPEWIINGTPGMLELARGYRGALGSLNLGSLMLLLVRGRLRARGDPVVRVGADLQEQLLASDIQDGLPVGYIRSEWPLVFVEFARPNPLQVPNRLSGLHVCEGAYVGCYAVPPFDPMHDRLERCQLLGLDPAKPTFVLEIVIIGSPEGKANALDDASQDVVLVFQDQDESLNAVLERHIEFFCSAAASVIPGIRGVSRAELEAIKPVIELLAKVMLYLNLDESDRVEVPARTALRQKYRRLGAKLSKSRQRKVMSVYDHWLLGSRLAPVEVAAAERPGPRPHWRRGHFRRIRFGEGLAQVRLGWIQPTLVNAAGLVGAEAASA